MHINISAIGDAAVSLLSMANPTFTQSLPTLIGGLSIVWETQVVTGELLPEQLLMLPDSPRLLLIDMETEFNCRDIRLAQSKVFSFIRNNQGLPYIYAPIIAVFDREPLAGLICEARDLIADWVLRDTYFLETANRIVFSLAKKNIFKSPGQELDVIFSLPSKTISFKGEAIQLSPTEYALAEIFFSRVNETIPLQDLVVFFKSIGSSTSMNNIRVVIFHLRMKLAQLTRNNWLLSSIYRRGYVLRRARGPKLFNTTESENEGMDNMPTA